MADETSVFDVVDTVLFVFVMVSIPIYFLVVIALIKYRHQLNSSFFTLSISVGVCDLVSTLHRYLTRAIPKAIWGASLMGNVWLPTLHLAGFWSLYFSQVTGVFLLGANRMTALAWPFKYKKIWNHRSIMCAIAIQWILPLGFSLPMLHPCCRAVFTSDFLVIFNNSEVIKTYTKVDIILEPGFFMPSIIMFYIVAFWKARKNARQTSPATNSKKKKNPVDYRAERNLAIMGALLSSIYVMICIDIVLCIVALNQGNHAFYELLVYLFYPLIDLLNMANPYLLLIFSSKFRPYFKAFVMCKNPNGGT